MKCLVRSVVTGSFRVEGTVFETGEEKKIEFTEKVRYYVALGYLKLKDLYTEIERPAKGKYKTEESNDK
jgi:hypothetical protein